VFDMDGWTRPLPYAPVPAAGQEQLSNRPNADQGVWLKRVAAKAVSCNLGFGCRNQFRFNSGDVKDEVIYDRKQGTSHQRCANDMMEMNGEKPLADTQ